MSKSFDKLLVTFLLLGIVVAACSFGPPDSCGDAIGGTADATVFSRYFTQMALVSSATGQSGTDGENGAQFATADTLEIRADTTAEVNVRVCIQGMSSSKIALDTTKGFAAGPAGLGLGSFDKGTYVIRVIVDDTLVKNFPFEIK